jgi:hypothetical protein
MQVPTTAPRASPLSAQAQLVSPEAQLGTGPNMVGFLNVMTGVIRAGSSGQAWVWNGMTSYLPTHPANSSATIDELELLLTGGRLAAPARALIKARYEQKLASTGGNAAEAVRVAP